MRMKKFDRKAVRQALTKQKEEESNKGGFVDDTVWKPTVPKKGKKTYKFKVLPLGNDVPWIKKRQHNIHTQDGNWEYKLCPSTIGKKCPICEYASELWKTDDPANQERAKKLFAKDNYTVNILVTKDDRNDNENEGKVFKYPFGVKVYDKLDEALNPEDEDEEELYFMDPDEATDFHLICQTVKDFNNYDASKFASKSEPLADSEKKIDAILEQAYDLEEEIAEEKFDSYDTLEEFLDEKIKGDVKPKKKKKVVEEEEEDDDDTPPPKSKKKVVEEDEEEDVPESKKEKKKVVEEEEDEDDDDLMRQLAEMEDEDED